MTSSLTSHNWMRFFISDAEWMRFFVCAATQTFNELAWKKHIIVVVDRPNCMDFIYHTEFEGVKIFFFRIFC